MVGGYSLYENGWNILPIKNVNAKLLQMDSEFKQADYNYELDEPEDSSDNVLGLTDEEHNEIDKEGEETKIHCKGGK
jgi:hypothetical protein